MALMIPLPHGTRELARQNTHPGLALDKYPESWDPAETRDGKLSENVQGPTLAKVVALTNAPPVALGDAARTPNPQTLYPDLFARWQTTVCGGAATFTGATAGPLTLHLARASALENAGICLHRVYGFAYLPGSGLKGLARAFAETVWLEGQADQVAGWAAIEAVFGWAPGSDEMKDESGKTITKPWKPKGVPKHGDTDRARAGSVIFHDAWPEEWPKLVTDILNSHHSKYYGETPAPPPGDWEDPVPVYFLSVKPKTPFRFAVAPRRDDEGSKKLAEQAREWLIGGLTQLGAGAKTASGYGDFTVDEPKVGPVTSAKRPSFTATLELVTPAFLAGAKQEQDDCDLRPATLRGQLRWWWRTMHAGFVDAATLRDMEAAIWGDTKQGGAVRVMVRSNGDVVPKPYNRQQILVENRVPRPNDNSIPGLAYHTYGMNDGGKPQRWYVEPGAAWTAIVAARSSKFRTRSVSAAVVLSQATAALHLLCRYGGVGAKSRKGFGSFADLPGFDLDAVKQAADDYRKACGLDGKPPPEAEVRSPSLERMLSLSTDVPTCGTNRWLALDQLAVAVQQFIKGVQPKHRRKYLGTPRTQRGAGAAGPRTAHDQRHASPALYHFAKAADGTLVARAVAFPAAELPNLADSRQILTDLLAALAADLPGRFRSHVAGKGTVAMPRPAGLTLANGQLVRAKVVQDSKGKGRLFAEVQGLVGMIENAPNSHALTIGEEVDLIIKYVNLITKQIGFRWPA